MAFCSSSGFGRLVDTDVIYTGPSITCGGTTVNPGDTVREYLSIVFICANEILEEVEGNSLPIPDGTGKKVAFVGSGTYTQSGGPDIVVPSGYMGILFWDGDEWSLSQSVEMPEVEGVDVLDPLGEEIPKEIAVAKYAASKDFLGIVDISDGSDIGYMLKAEHSGDSELIVSGFLRPNGSIGESSTWITTKNYIDILPGLYSSNLILQG